MNHSLEFQQFQAFPNVIPFILQKMGSHQVKKLTVSLEFVDPLVSHLCHV